MSRSTSKRKVLAAILAVIVVVAVASAVIVYQSNITSQTVTSVATQTKPKLSLDHVTSVSSTPLPLSSTHWPSMLASKLGYYDKYGLTVETVGTSGALEVLSSMVSGKADFGGLNVGVGVPARGNGTNVRYVFMTQERDPDVVYALEKSGIRSPKDLEGKTMGLSFASAEYNTMALFGKAAGFDHTKVKYVNVPTAQYITYLVSGQIDATMQYLTNYYNFEAAAEKAGQKLVTFFRYDYVDIYGTGVAATDSFIKQHPDVVKVFTEGFAYGLQYMIYKPKEPSTLLAGMMTGTQQETLYSIVRTYSEFKSVLPRQSGQPYGIMDDKTWNATINVIVDYLGAREVAPKDIYTNEFVPTQYVPKAQMLPPIIPFYNNVYSFSSRKQDTLTSPQNLMS